MDSISLRNKLFKKYHTNAKMYNAIKRKKPCEFIKETLKTWTVDELKRLVNHFICLDATKFPHIFMGILFWMPTDEIKKILMYLEKMNKHMFDTILNSDKLYCQIYSLTTWNHYTQCIEYDWVECLKHLDNINGYFNKKHICLDSDIKDKMMINDSVKCLEYLYTNYQSMFINFDINYIGWYYSAFNCSLYLKLQENGGGSKFSFCDIGARKGIQYLKLAYKSGYKFTDKTCEYAIESHQLECLKFAHMNGCKLNDNLCSIAIKHNDIECLQYVHQNGCKLDANSCTIAIKNNYFECLKYVHSNGCKLDANSCMLAIKNNYFECLQYVHSNGCKLDEKMCYVAAKCGYLKCLQYIHTSGCKYNRNMLITISHKKCREYVVGNM